MWEMRKWGNVLCAGLLLCACTDDDGDDTLANVPERLVGSVEDSDVAVAAVTDGDQTRLFFCGGDSSYATATRWFNLAFRGDALNADDGAWHLRATRDRDGIHGEITHDPEEARKFEAVPVANGTLAGLYEGKAGCGRLGLIVTQPDRDTDPAAQGACVGDGHDPEQVNPIAPVESVDGKIRVQAPSEDKQVLLQVAGIKPL